MLTRRRVMTSIGASGLLLAPRLGMAHSAAGRPRSLSFYNTHTGERLQAEYWADGGYSPDALAAIDHVLRDHRNQQVHAIDTKLLDLLHALRAKLDSDRPYHIISG